MNNHQLQFCLIWDYFHYESYQNNNNSLVSGTCTETIVPMHVRGRISPFVTRTNEMNRLATVIDKKKKEGRIKGDCLTKGKSKMLSKGMDFMKGSYGDPDNRTLDWHY